MEISLYYIPGISANSQPHFASVEQRDTKLSSFKLVTLDEAYFPPLSTNRFKITRGKLASMTTPNYMSLNSYGKTFYYFIDGYEYVNEQTLIYDISLDVITTFYFDINFIRFERTRSLLYSNLRDNISKDSTFYFNNLIDNDKDKPALIVIQFKDRLATPIRGQDFSSLKNTIYGISGDKRFIVDGLKTLIIPLTTSASTSIIVNGYANRQLDSGALTERTDYSVILPTDIIQDLANDPNVFNMYLTKRYPLGISYNATSEKIILDDNNMSFSNGFIIPTKYNSLQLKMFSIREIITALSIPNDAGRDSNYKNIMIGEYNDNASIPIELLDRDTKQFNIYCITDFSTGIRQYYINDSNLLNMKWVHICNSVENIPLYNDNYNIYLQQNKGSLTTGIQMQKTRTYVNVANQFFNQNAATTFKGASTGGVAGGIVAGIESTINTGVSLWDSLYTIDKTIQANKENAYYSPDTIKMGNTYSNDYINNYLDAIVITYLVADYDEVIEMRKYIGYPSHDIQYNKQVNQLFDAVIDGRRLLMGECEVSLPQFCTREFIYRIKDRIKNGVRFYTNINELGS